MSLPPCPATQIESSPVATIGAASCRRSTARARTPLEHVETTRASAATLWSCWIDVGTWSEWAGWVGSATLEGPFEIGAHGRVGETTGYRTTFTVATLDAPYAQEFIVHIFGADVHMSREIVDESEVTTFKHSVWITGRLRRVWVRPLKRRGGELAESMRRLATYAESLHR